MSSLKLRKIAKIVKEMNTNPSQSRYDISGLTLGLCKFFYRTSQQLFQDLGQGDYTIDTSSNSQVLVIQNSELLKTMEAIQVCYILDTTSSKYETDFNVDINQLKDEYNHLVDDVHALWDYVKRVGMVSDDTTIPLILPQLDTNELWIKTEDGYQGISLTDAEGVLKGVITEYTNEMKSLLDQYVENPLKPRLDAHVEEVNKPELDRYVEEINKPDLDEYTQMLEERLQIMIDQAVGDKGLIPNGKDWFEIELGNWLVTDLFNKNYKNYPPQLTSSDNAGVVKKDISDGGRTQVIRYYTTTGKMFFAVRVNEVWSEWQEVGGSADSMQFTQANHGFVFTAVTLDGATRKWTKANKYTGADGIAVKVDNDRFDVVIRGVVNIPANARDDKGNAYVYDEYYFLSQDVNGGLTIDKPVIGTFQSLIHVSELDGKQVAYVDVQNPVSLDYTVLDSDTADMIGIGTYKTTLRTADTIADLKGLDLKVGDVVEVLGYYAKGDGADHKRKIESSDDGSGVLLNNGKYANIVHNGTVNISWFGAKKIKDILLFSKNKVLNIDTDVETSENITVYSDTDIKGKGVLGLKNGAMLIFGENNDNEFHEYYKPIKLLGDTFNSKVSSLSKKGEYEINFENVDNLRVGQYILIKNGYCDTWRLLENHSDIDWYRDGTEIYGGQISKVAKINGNTVTITEPLLFDVSNVPFTYFSDVLENANNLPEYQEYNVSSAYALDGLHNCNIEITIKRLDDVKVTRSVCIQGAYDNSFKINVLDDNELKESIYMSNCYNNNISVCSKANSICLHMRNFCQYNTIKDVTMVSKNINRDSSFVMALGCSKNKIINISGICENTYDEDNTCFYENTSFGNVVNDIQVIGYGRTFMQGWSKYSVTNNVIATNCYRGALFLYNYKIIANNIINKNTIEVERSFNTNQGLLVQVCRNCNFNNIVDETFSGKSNIQSTESNYNNIYLNNPLNIDVKYGSNTLTNITLKQYINLSQSSYTTNEPPTKIHNIFSNGIFLYNVNNAQIDGGVIKKGNVETFPNGECIISNAAQFTKFSNLELIGDIGIATTSSNEYSKRIFLDNITFKTTVDTIQGFDLSSPLFVGIPRAGVAFTHINNNGQLISVYKHIGKTTKDIGTQYWVKIIDYSINSKLDTTVYKNLMEQEGVYEDYANYRVEQIKYEKEQRAEQQAKYEAYQQALTNNPNLTYEEFIASYPSVIPIIEEPTIPQTVQDFMKKYL